MKKILLIVTLAATSAWGFAQAQRLNPDAARPNGESSEDQQKRPDFERPRFPLHWGKPPAIQTKDYRPLPGNFGMGSSTLANWIKDKIAEDKENGKLPGDRKPDDLTDIEKQDPKRIEKETLEAVREGKLSVEDAVEIGCPTQGNGQERRVQTPHTSPAPPVPEEVKESIESVKALEKSLHEEIKAKVDELGKDATREDIKVAVESFKEANKARFEEIKEKHEAIREKMKDARPEKPERPALSDELKAKVEVLQEKRKEMHEAQKELHQNLKEASEEDRKEMIADFKEANKAKHEEIKSKTKEVKEEIRALVETEATRTSDLKVGYFFPLSPEREF